MSGRLRLRPWPGSIGLCPSIRCKIGPHILTPSYRYPMSICSKYLGMGWFGQGHNIQGKLCPRGATSNNFWWGETPVGDEITLNVWCHDATLFVYFSYFYNIHSLNHIHTIHKTVGIRRGLSPYMGWDNIASSLLQEVPAILKCLQCPGMQSREWEMFIEARRGFAWIPRDIFAESNFVCRQAWIPPV